MSPDVARRSHAVLMQAVELEGPQRAAYVNSACAGDPLLAAHVAALLAAMTRSETFLAASALAETRAARPQPPKAAPDAIRNYRIVRTIGVGGMATVYEAMQHQPRRRVALKVLRQGLAHTSAVERFRFETEILARLQHPGVAQIFEAGAYDDGHGFSTPFFAMEYVADAQTITAFAHSRDLTLRERLELILPVCDAVQHGHQHGVIHRDLKPGNILVDATGRPKVIDFGVARSSEAGGGARTRDTGVGQLIGTLNYMSPEQCSGSTDIDIRCDIYALGVILYELVCGCLPHDVARMPVPAALRVIQEQDPPPPRAVDERLRGDIDAIVMKAMDKSPQRRYPTVAALAADIQRHLGNETVEARPPTAFYRATRFVRRHRLFIGSLTLALAAIIGGAALSGVFAYHTWRESQGRISAEHRALAERDAARWQSYVASIAATAASLQANEYAHARTRLALAPPEHRGWEWRYLDARVERSQRTVRAHDDMIFAFAASPDGRRLATGCRDGALRLWDADSGALLRSLDGTPGAAVHALAFSPDAARLVSGSADNSVRLWDVAAGQLIRVLGRHEALVRSVAWGAAARVASAASDGVARLWDADTGELLRTFDDQPGGIHGVAFDPAGSRLTTWGGNGPIWIRDADGTRILQRLPFDAAIEALAFNHDASLVAAAGGDGRLCVWHVATGALRCDLTDSGNPSTIRAVAFSPAGDRLAAGHVARSAMLHSLVADAPPRGLHGHEEAVSGLAFSRDGSKLDSASWDGTLRRWDVNAIDRAERSAVLAGHDDQVLAVAFSPDGTLLASGGRDDTVRLWDPRSGAELRTLCGHSADVSSLAFSPDSAQLVSGSHDNTLRLWNPLSGECAGVLLGHARPVWTVAFSPDGRRLASSGDDAAVHVWDVATRSIIHTLAGHAQRVIQVAFSPDGTLLASASRDASVRLWDVESGALLHELTGHQSDVFAVLFSPDGDALFTGSRDQRVRVWDVASGRCTHTLAGHGQFITSLALLPDRSRLAAGAWSGEILLWALPQLEWVASFKSDRRPVRSVAFSPDGRFLASGSYDKTVRLFDAAPPRSLPSYEE